MNARTARIISLAALAAVMLCTPGSAGEPLSGETAKLGYEKLQGLVGRWETTTPDGKKAVLTLEPVANASALMEPELVEDDPSHSNMVTFYHLDNDRLLLTHYCMAGNQPRMRAAAYDPETRTLTFEFLDATNLKSPNDGHMRRVVFRFVDDHHFTSRWTFYKDQKPVFDEEFKYTRVTRVAVK